MSTLPVKDDFDVFRKFSGKPNLANQIRKLNDEEDKDGAIEPGQGTDQSRKDQDSEG